MTPEALADLHARCFTVPRPFSAQEFGAFLAPDLCFLVGDDRGFALGRCVLDEAELLTLTVAPEHRRQGLARALVEGFEATATSRGAATAFLEVAADNVAARALYQKAGYRQSGCRKGYYRKNDGSTVNAVLMRKRLVSP